MCQIKVRFVLWVLTFLMFFIYQMSRFNVNMSIVAITHEELLKSNGTTRWDVKALILGSFFWLGWVTELTGAYLIDIYGCRNIMMISYFLNAIFCFLFPFAYVLHPFCAVVVRIGQGFVLGPTWPAMAWISSRWIPKNERSRYMSSYHGGSFGTSFTNLMAGIIIDLFGWPYVFHGTGLLSLLWVLFWWPNVYNSPSEHPRISTEEKDYIEEHVEIYANRKINNVTSKKQGTLPWKDVFTSKPFWAILIMFLAMMWFIITLAMQMPSYFDDVHHLDIRTNGYLVSIPDICRMIVGIKFPIVMDYITKKEVISIKTARRLSNGISSFIPGVLLIFLAFYGSTNVVLASVLLILTVSISGSGTSALLANVVDISPNYASTLLGCLKTFSNIYGIASPIIVNYILIASDGNWMFVFLITSFLITMSSIIYIIFCSTDVQEWNEKFSSEKLEERKDLLEMKNIVIIQAKENEENLKECT